MYLMKLHVQLKVIELDKFNFTNTDATLKKLL